MENKDKKTDVQKVEKVETAVKEQPVAETKAETSSYVKIKDLTVKDIKKLSKAPVVFVAKQTKNSRTFTFEIRLHPDGLLINCLGDKVRINLTLSEYNEIRLYYNKTSSYYLDHPIENCEVPYRLVKGYKENGERYYSVQYWLTPNGKCRTYFFNGSELQFMVSFKKAGKADFKFIEKPKDLIEEETSDINEELDLDIL